MGKIMFNKRVVINTEKDYNKFIKKIFMYRSVLFKKVSFNLENTYNNENIDLIIKALNIKNRKQRINYIYDEACNLIDNKFKGINICGFTNGKCYVQLCSKKDYYNGCCRKCLYQTNYGCSTKNLACKLFNCSEVKSRYEVITFKDLKLLKVLSLKNQFIVKSDYFSKREDVLKDLYSYSIIYSTIRVLLRL